MRSSERDPDSRGAPVRIATVLVAVTLLSLPCTVSSQTTNLTSEPIRLASGEEVFNWAAVSYNKLRRGTAIELKYDLFIKPDACFVLLDDGPTGRRGLKLEMAGSPGLVMTDVRQTGVGKKTVIKGARISNCADTVEFKVRIEAPVDHLFGLQKISGRISWQAVNATGVLPMETMTFEFPMEVVERDDRTAKYNKAYAYRPSADLLWRIPSFPFVLVYCAVVGGDCPD